MKYLRGTLTSMHSGTRSFWFYLFRIDKRHWAGELIILEILIVIHKHHYHLYYHLVPLFCTNLICNCKNYCLYIWIVRIPQVQYYECTYHFTRPTRGDFTHIFINLIRGIYIITIDIEGHHQHQYISRYIQKHSIQKQLYY